MDETSSISVNYIQGLLFGGTSVYNILLYHISKHIYSIQSFKLLYRPSGVEIKFG